MYWSLPVVMGSPASHTGSRPRSERDGSRLAERSRGVPVTVEKDPAPSLRMPWLGQAEEIALVDQPFRREMERERGLMDGPRRIGALVDSQRVVLEAGHALQRNDEARLSAVLKEAEDGSRAVEWPLELSAPLHEQEDAGVELAF